MHIILSLALLIVQFISVNLIQINDINNDEELIYNGVVYFDDDTNVENTGEWLNEEKIIEQVDNVSQNENTEENSKNFQKKNNTNSNDIQVVYQEENIDEDEEEIIFHDDFDTGYWEDLEEIWND